MKIKNIHIILIISLITALWGCREEIDLELNDSYPRLVVEGGITTDSAYQYIELSKTGSYFSDNKLPVISGAAVKVTDGTNVYDFAESTIYPGRYYSKQKMKQSYFPTYRLTIAGVDIDNDNQKEVYTAEEKMKSFLYVDSLKYEYYDHNGRDAYKVFGYTQEPPTLGDFYMFRYFVNGHIVTDTLDEVRFYSDEFVNGNYLAHIYLGSVYASKGDTLTIETNSITEDYYNFIISFFLETKWGSAPFAGPPANVETNIDNGAVGYFNTEARTRFSIVFE